MRFFIIKLLFFLGLPAIVWLIIEMLLPINTFTHRQWEAVRFSVIPHQFSVYPNIDSEKKSVGDLCYNSSNAIVKNEYWITDSIGFRNNKFIQQADVLLIGDSFFTGSSLSQENVFCNKLQQKMGNLYTIYNFAPADFKKFDKFLRLGIIKKPKLIIYSIVERNCPSKIELYGSRIDKLKNYIEEILGYKNFNVYLDRMFRFYSVEWLRAKIYNQKGVGMPSTDQSGMFFEEGLRQGHRTSELMETLSNLRSYKKYCDSLQIKFMFLPMPDKETVYYERVSFAHQPDYLIHLDSLLQKSNVLTFNTLNLYNDYRKSNNQLLYHLDDTHWNENATELVSTHIADTILKKHLLD